MDKEKILKDLLKIIKDLTRGVDTDFSGGLGPHTRIVGDLGFESVAVVEMIAAIEKHYRRRDLPFQELAMRENSYHDFNIQDIADFLYKHLEPAEGG